jgi:putative transcription factor
MVDCEMCGAKKANSKVKIEKTIMTVCNKCEKYGEKLETPNMRNTAKSEKYNNYQDKNIKEELLIETFAKDIKNARRNKNMSPEELAKKLNEKESIILKIEAGNFRPRIDLAKKIGLFLGIKLVEKKSLTTEDDSIKNMLNKNEKGSQGLTMGDLLNKAMKRKK